MIAAVLTSAVVIALAAGSTLVLYGIGLAVVDTVRWAVTGVDRQRVPLQAWCERREAASPRLPLRVRYPGLDRALNRLGVAALYLLGASLVGLYIALVAMLEPPMWILVLMAVALACGGCSCGRR